MPIFSEPVGMVEVRLIFCETIIKRVETRAEHCYDLLRRDQKKRHHIFIKQDRVMRFFKMWIHRPGFACFYRSFQTIFSRKNF